MSTILNTLKKLEEEKSVLDRSLNLKGLVLQTDRAVYPRQEKEQGNHARGLIVLIIAGIFVGVSLGVYFNPTDKASAKNIAPAKPIQTSVPVPKTNSPAPEVAPPAPEQTTPVQTAPAPVQPAQNQAAQKEVARGIPLSSIHVPAKTTPPAVEPVKANPAPSAPQPPVQVAKASPPVSASAPAPVVVKAKKSSTAAKTAPPADNADMESAFTDQVDDNKPESEIIAMEVLPESYEADTGIAGAKVMKLQSAQPAKPKEPSGYSGIAIPGVKMKGIIFFGANSPLNYILVTGPKDANQKLKIGETFQDATLTEVQPDRAVFSFKGQITQLRIGE